MGGTWFEIVHDDVHPYLCYIDNQPYLESDIKRITDVLKSSITKDDKAIYVVGSNKVVDKFLRYYAEKNKTNILRVMNIFSIKDGTQALLFKKAFIIGDKFGSQEHVLDIVSKKLEVFFLEDIEPQIIEKVKMHSRF